MDRWCGKAAEKPEAFGTQTFPMPGGGLASEAICAAEASCSPASSHNLTGPFPVYDLLVALMRGSESLLLEAIPYLRRPITLDDDGELLRF